ncbi:MAG TPA: ribosome biogenesis GTPase Der [Spirochaetota bacterium]|nr:ribosome biogenesis GTPase Der [Spirochaetota bacterium]HOL57992.1 ribosome biogenesis GTPase Der [Spirochaetota bacterium]HPP05493.1 ribosome biogenesis GTPase Der [Spirochaetota bacterium]
MDGKVSKMREIPVVSIIGRPNVGKSTLFNRLIGKKKAIIDPTPGVTRDFIKEDFTIEDKVITLIDTGGLTDSDDPLDLIVQKKTYEAIDNSDLIIFLVEYNTPLPIEKEYAKYLLEKNKRVILAINKCDTIDKDNNIFDFYEYGLNNIITISAAHNRNIELLKEKILNLLDIEKYNFSKQEKEKDPPIKIAIIGKPNVGKSSLLNKIIGKERSIVSEIPGTTRDIIDEKFIFNNREFIIIDTAGIRKKSKVKDDVEYYSVNRAIKAIEQADVTLLVIDAECNISEQDKKITDQIVKNGKGLIILLNKWDKEEQSKENLNKKMNLLRFKFPLVSYAPIIPTSAKTGFGIVNILKKAIFVYSEMNKKIATSELNKFIEKCIKKYSPSSKDGHIKIYYGTQTSNNPVEFVFFINKKKLLTENYKQYIINKFRETFGFEGVPIKINFRDK